MQIDIATLAEYAIVDQSGKMSIMGIFTQFNAARYPVAHPRFFVCLRIACRPIEAGSSHTLAIQIQDPDGKALARVQGPFVVPNITVDGGYPYVQAVFEFAGTQFPAPGTFSVEIAIDGQHSHSIALQAVAIKPPQQS